MQRPVVPLRKLPRVKQLLGQAPPLEKQKSRDSRLETESFALEGKQKGHWSPAINRSSAVSVNKGWAVGMGQDRELQAKRNSQAHGAGALPVRAHPTLPEQGEQGWRGDGSWAQARAWVIREVQGSKASPRLSWDVSPWVRAQINRVPSQIQA